MLEATQQGHTRRAFIKRSGLLAGAAWLAATGWDKTVGRAIAAFSPSLNSRQRQNYDALVEAVAASDANAIPASAATDAGERLASWYDTQPRELQRVAESVLDALDGAFEGRSFHRASRTERLDFIRERVHGPYRDRPDRRGSGEAKAGAARRQEIERISNDPAHRGDPNDFSSVKPAAADRSAPAPPKPKHTDEDVRRGVIVEAALVLVAAPFVAATESADGDGLAKVHPVAV